jgi:AICAR transformylase/IMP cyclohydrolase PurH
VINAVLFAVVLAVVGLTGAIGMSRVLANWQAQDRADEDHRQRMDAICAAKFGLKEKPPPDDK